MLAALPARDTSAAATTAPVAHLAPLTGLRFCAALLVIWHHFGPYPAWQDLATRGNLPALLASNLGLSGFVGVDLFFVLSGFILTYSYLTPAGKLRGGMRAFWLARLARIYPLYLLAALLAAPPFFWQQGPSAAPVTTGLSVLTLTQAWLPASASVWNPPGWSLSVEAVFYLLFPLLAPLCARLPARRVRLALVLLWLACLAVPLPYLLNMDSGVTWSTVIYNPLWRLPEFLIGLLAGRLFALSQRQAAAAPRAFPRWAAPAAAVGSIVAVALAPAWVRPFIRSGLLDPLFAVLIYGLAARPGLLGRLLAQPLLVLLGEASYGMYVLHWPAWDWLTRLLHLPSAAARASSPFVLDYMSLVFALSILALWMVERPARRYLRAALLTRPAAPAVRVLPGTPT